MTDKRIPELSCAVVRDLLPLYHDGVVSEETERAVEKHIDRCPDCAVELKKLDEELPLPKDTVDINGGFRRMVKKNKKKRRIINLVCFLAGAVAILSVALWFLRTQCIIPVDPGAYDVIEAHRCEFDEGKLYMLINFPVAYEIETTHENGVVELKSKRPIWNPEMYGQGTTAMMMEVGLEKGDKKLRINGKDICDIGEPEKKGEYPAYFDAYYEYLGSDNEDDLFDIWYDGYDMTEEKYLGMIIYSPDGVEGNYIVWDMYGNELEDYLGTSSSQTDKASESQADETTESQIVP